MSETEERNKIRKGLLEKAGIVETGVVMPSLESLKKTEWSNEFESLMRNRLLMGAMRYGLIKHGCKSKYDRIGSITKRIKLYKQTGNQEHLVDVANLCLLEFCQPNHKNAHFESIDDGEHVGENTT